MLRTPQVVAMLGLAAAAHAHAQIPTEPVSRRFSFAELFTGIDVAALPAAHDGGGALSMPARTIPRLTIAGLHFWGHADFAVTFPVGRGTRGDGAVQSRFTSGIETRGRWYLRPARTDGISPFLGAGLGAIDLQLGDGPRLYRMQPMAQAGLAWRSGRTLVEAGWTLRPTVATAYPVSRGQTELVRPPSHAVFVGVHRLYETTASLTEPIRSGEWGARERRLRETGRLSGPTIALGLSSPILIGSDAYNRERRPDLAARPRGRAMLDLGLGWHVDPLDVQVNVAWRHARFPTTAFGFDQENVRQSVALEAFRFLGDWHGFVPFVGPVLSLERLRVREMDRGVMVTNAVRDLVAPGLIFGWDIRPTRAQSVLLRTNLRWFPALRLPLADGTQAFDQLEFNFIQLVWYPRR